MIAPRVSFRPALLAALLAALPLLAGALRIQDDILPSVLQSRNYSYQLKGLGGNGGPYSFSCPAPCALPRNYALSPGGLLSFTASGTNTTDAGLYRPAITVSDGISPPATQTLRLEVLKAESWSNWCRRGHFGGDYSTVAASPFFSTNSIAVAGSPNGVIFTSDAGKSWSPIFSLGPLPAATIAVDQCAAGMKFWAATGGVSISSLRNMGGPFAGTVMSDPGGLFRVDGLGPTGTVTLETKLPATWTGGRRRIRQAYAQCTGEMLVSDDNGGVLYRNGAGTWAALNSFGGITGPFSVRDIAYGDIAKHTLGAALVHDIGAGITKLYTIDTALSAIWAKCADLPAAAAGANWLSLALTPDGRLVAGSSRGEVKIIPVGSCGLTPTINPGPGFREGTVALNPPITGFVISPCYGSGTNKGIYAVTGAGLYYSADITAPAGNPFLRQGRGLLSESLGDLAVSNACADGRLIVATRGRGLFFGDASGFCPAQTGQDGDAADFNSFTATRAFVSPTATVCGPLNAPIGLHAGSRSAGLFRVDNKGRELSYAGATREKSIVDLDTAFDGTRDVLYAASASGVYRSLDGGLHYADFYPTDEPLQALRGSPAGTLAAAFAISASSLYGSITTPQPWSRLFPFPGVAGAQAADLYVGGPLSSNANDVTVWIAYGTGGLLEFHTVGGTPSLLTQSTGLNGYDVRVVTATQQPGVPNLVYLHAKDGFGNYRLLSGIKPVSPDFNQQVGFSALAAAGLPTNEEAIHIVVERTGLATAGYIWVLLPRQGLYLSTDGGGSFTPITGTRTNGAPGNGMPPNFIPIALIPARDFNSAAGKRDVAVLVAGKGVYYSNDGGNTYCYGPTQVNQVPVSGNPAFVAAKGAGGAPAQPAAAPQGGIIALTTSTQSNDILLAGTDHGVFYSEDGGANWANRSFADAPVGALLVHQGDDAILAASGGAIYRSTDWGANWTTVYSGGTPAAFTQNSAGSQIVAALSNGSSLISTDAGLTFTAATGPLDGQALAYNPATSLAAGATAPYWMAGTTSGAAYSSNGSAWTTANGAGDYTLTGAGGSWASVANVGGSPSKVLIGNGSAGLFRTLDGGTTWRKVSGPGSGLETTSQNAGGLLTAATSYGTTDALVGMVGSTTGGVYLSGDNGEHWTQLNQGYDPANLSISSLVKSSCGTCPVQYYSGTYGNGVYTRTVTVNPPPAISGWCFGSTGCACSTTAGSGPQEGGQAFVLCGSNFGTANVAVEFDGLAVGGGCTFSSTTITCPAGVSGTPPHFPGAAVIRVRNSDTRQGIAGVAYSYTAGTPRASGLTVAKAGSDAILSWSCASCTSSVPARVYRSQDAPFTLNLEQYNGGTGGTYTNAGALAASANASYFWSVE